jgi:hypothetical protein
MTILAKRNLKFLCLTGLVLLLISGTMRADELLQNVSFNVGIGSTTTCGTDCVWRTNDVITDWTVS